MSVAQWLCAASVTGYPSRRCAEPGVCSSYAAHTHWRGCGVSAHEQVQAKVQQFAHATASRDYTTLCHQVLAPALVERLTAAG